MNDYNYLIYVWLCKLHDLYSGTASERDLKQLYANLYAKEDSLGTLIAHSRCVYDAADIRSGQLVYNPKYTEQAMNDYRIINWQA